MSRFRRMLLAGVITLGGSLLARAEPLAPVAVPPAETIAPDKVVQASKKSLDVRFEALTARFAAWKKRADAFNETYGEKEFAEDSPEAKKGEKEQSWLAEESEQYSKASVLFAADVAKLERSSRISSMNAMARKLSWTPKERARLAAALDRLALDGDPDVTIATISTTWKTIEMRGQDDALARAAGGNGPVAPGAGTQSFNDCTIFSLANASGTPYGGVAARATTLIHDGAWRPSADRANAGGIIERHGLNGDEVIMLTEALGQVEVVPSTDFGATLVAGHPILATVVVVDDKGEDDLHQVVLTKSFRHDGETWYEMLDSTQGPQERRYLTARELQVVLHENGIMYRPEPGRTPQLLRPKE